MTDNEIIKCLNSTVGVEHIGIYCTDKDDNYTTTLKLTDIIDLINRQQEEIERLQKAGKEAVSCFARMESLYKIKCKELEIAKSEAIKEFWNRLKAEKFAHKNFGELVYVEDGDNLVKEMTE